MLFLKNTESFFNQRPFLNEKIENEELHLIFSSSWLIKRQQQQQQRRQQRRLKTLFVFAFEQKNLPTNEDGRRKKWKDKHGRDLSEARKRKNRFFCCNCIDIVDIDTRHILLLLLQRILPELRQLEKKIFCTQEIVALKLNPKLKLRPIN